MKIQNAEHLLEIIRLGNSIQADNDVIKISPAIALMMK